MRKDFLWGGAVAAHQVEGGYIKGISEEEVIETTEKNAVRLFRAEE